MVLSLKHVFIYFILLASFVYQRKTAARSDASQQDAAVAVQPYLRLRSVL